MSLLSNNPRLKITLLILLLLAAAAGISWLVIVVSANMFRPPPNAVSVEGPWHITHEGKQIEGQTLPSYISGRSAEEIPEGVYEFRAVFETDSRMEIPELVMPYTAGNALRVLLDGEYLGQAGDMGRGRSNIWNIALNFLVPHPLEPGKHTLTAEIYILYEGGPLLAPYIIDKKSAFHTRWLIFFSQKTMNGMLTAVILLAIIFIIIGIISPGTAKGLLFVGTGMILYSIFLQDFNFLSWLPVSYFLYKKIVVAAVYAASFLLVLGFCRMLNKTLKLIDKGVLLLYALLFAALALSGNDIISLFLAEPRVFTTHFGLLFFLSAAIVVVMMDIFSNYRLVVQERTRAEEFRREGMRDMLTEAYNRKIMPACTREAAEDLVRGIRKKLSDTPVEAAPAVNKCPRALRSSLTGTDNRRHHQPP